MRTKDEDAGGGPGGSPGGGGAGGAAAVLALLGVVLLAGPARAGHRVSPVQEALPDHGTFTELLRDVVHEDLVDYQAVQARRELLDRYLEELAVADPEALGPEAEDERLAFWINAYNACMLKLVADHYPIEKSGSLLGRLKNTVAGRPANSVWQIEEVFTREHCRVAGEPRSQDEIEHEIIRPMGDPRIHFAVNCAALSCPRLADEAYTGERLDQQLDRQVRVFIDRSEHFQIVERGQDPTIRVNKVLDWFGEDFGGPEGVKEFLAGYLSGPEADLVARDETDVEYFEYDWTLNDVER